MTLKAVLAVAFALTVYKEDAADSPEKRAQMTAVGYAIAEFARTRNERAFLLTWGRFESNYSLRVHIGRCHPWECDRGLARGPWQAHRNGMAAENWARMIGVENTRAQAEHAAKMARWALGRCGGDARCAFRLLGGLSPTTPLRGEDERVAAYERTLAKIP